MRKMLKLIAAIAILTFALGHMAPLAVSQTTPNIGLNIPATNTPNWGSLLNQNFSLLDLLLSGNQALTTLSVTNNLQAPQLTTWVNTTPYASGAAVFYRGVLYQSLSAGNTGNVPSSSPSFWSTSFGGSTSGALLIANNLSDLASTTTARTNLGLGSAAIQQATAFAQVANNLSDLSNAGTARTNLGLGTAATQPTSAFDAAGAASTAQSNAQASSLQKASNLSDLANAGTARTNLGLGSVSTLAASAVAQTANNLSDLQSATNARTNLGLGAMATASGPNFPANPQNATYQATAADFAACKSIPVSSGTFTITLVASTSQPANGQCILVINYGSGVVTIAPSGQNINGSTGSLSLPAGSATAPTGALVQSIGANYVGIVLGSGSGSAGALLAANNLSDLQSASTARTNLGLGSASTLASTAVAQTANNLSDLANASTARTNLGLGTAATQALSAFAQTVNNLSDLASPSTARTNLGFSNGTLGHCAIYAATGTLVSSDPNCDYSVSNANGYTFNASAGLFAKSFNSTDTVNNAQSKYTSGSGGDSTCPTISGYDIFCFKASQLQLSHNGGSYSPVATTTSPLTPTSLLATGIVDGQAPVTITTSSTATLGGTYNSGYTYNQDATASAAVTYTLPNPVAGKQYCVKNSNNGTAADTGTIEVIVANTGTQSIIYNGAKSTSGYVVSSGAAGDAACLVAISSTQWETYPQVGTWTLH